MLFNLESGISEVVPEVRVRLSDHGRIIDGDGLPETDGSKGQSHAVVLVGVNGCVHHGLLTAAVPYQFAVVRIFQHITQLTQFVL